MLPIYIIDVVGFFIFFLGLFILLYVIVVSKNNKDTLKKRKNYNPRVGVLIPARDESKVIRGLLESIKGQTYKVNMEDVFIIVETKDDPTVNIAAEYGARIVYRHNLDLKRKGYALNDAIEEILNEDIKIDLFFIFDADNILDSKFFERMLPAYLNGYDAAIGCRRIKNSKRNSIVICSGLTFNMINTIGNDKKNRHHGNLIFSGTGMFISKELVLEWNGFPFHSLTEDYEMSMNLCIDGKNTYYVDNAYFYDDQPNTLSESIVQRTRWVKGFFQARKLVRGKFRKALKNPDVPNRGALIENRVSILPYALMISGAVIGMLGNLVIGIIYIFTKNHYMPVAFYNALTVFALMYLVLFFFTIFMIALDPVLHKWSLKDKLKGIFLNGLFLTCYIHCAIKALFTKDLGWNKIEHKN